MNTHQKNPSAVAFMLWMLISLSWLTTGCSTFNRDWGKAADLPATDIHGRWQGTWKSDASGHSGRLRCILKRLSAEEYQARFHAKYQKIFSFSYTVVLPGTSIDGAFQFTGDANLGWYAGGKYHYEGRITATNFFSTYHCKSDYGSFRMSRPK